MTTVCITAKQAKAIRLAMPPIEVIEEAMKRIRKLKEPDGP